MCVELYIHRAPYIELLYLCLVATRPLDADADAYWGRVPVCLKTFPSIVIKYIEYTTNTLSQVVSTIVYSLYSQGVVQLVSLTFPVHPLHPPLVTRFYFCINCVFYGFLTSFKAPFDLDVCVCE